MRTDRSQSRPLANQGKALPALVFIQLLVAVVAVGVMVFVGAKIGPLLQEKARLETDIASYQKQVSSLQSALQGAKTELQTTKTELEETRQRLRDTVDMARYMHRLDPVDLKVIFSRYPKQARALELILHLKEQGVGWHLGGQTPNVGFDSPSFATYVLKKLNLPGGAVTPGDTLLATSRRLFEALPPASGPKVGDLVFYPAGYVLFYFEDKNHQPFVVGMTPAGIAALDPKFAKPVGYRKSGLGN